jgi:hypothetical protein
MLMALHSGPIALMHGHSGCPRKQNSPSAKITPPSIPIKQRLDAAAMSYRLQLLLRHFKSCHLARMSDGHFCIIRDLGPVKGGKGLKHHEVVVDFSWRALAGFVLLRRRRSPLQALQAEISPTPISAKNRNQGSWRRPDPSDGNPWQVRNSYQAVLTRERERPVAALGLSDAENPVMPGVVDREGSSIFNHQPTSFGKHSVS